MTDRTTSGEKPLRVRLAGTAALVVVGSLLSSACGADSTDSTEPRLNEQLTGSITVSAAASLTGAFEALADGFERANPEIEVSINFGSSGTLATQIAQGAPVDVAAFADTEAMSDLSDGNLLRGPAEIFATNQLVIVTPPDNPKRIDSLDDLDDGALVSLCVDTAPCGKFAGRILAQAAVSIPDTSITRGTDVKATLGAVTEGDADAAIVYVTDAPAVGDRVNRVEISDADNVTVSYPIAATRSDANPDAAASFVDYVLSADGQRVLARAGFGPA